MVPTDPGADPPDKNPRDEGAPTAQKDAIAAMATLDRIIGRAAAVEPPGL